MHVFAGIRTRRLASLAALPLAAALVLTGCSSSGGDDGADGGSESKAVTLVVHDSFVDGDAFAAAAKEATGYDVEVMTAGDGGELTSKLVLTKGAPIADAFFGVDNTFASRLIENDVAAPIAPTEMPDRAGKFAAEIAPDAEGGEFPLIPIDMGATCVNIDTAWFAEHDLAEPEAFDDLADPAYKDLTVLLDPTASSTGASFMIATIAALGENDYAEYWKSLVDNGARIDQGWDDAYYTDFTGASENGAYPIVVSYSTSPAFTVNDDESESTTRALLDTCSTQVEYAGVLDGAENPEGAKAVIDYLLSGDFQSTIADEMYMYPIDESIELPAAWAKFAPLPSDEQVHDIDPATISDNLNGWLKSVGEAVGI